MAKNAFNLQLPVREETKDLFEETFKSSGCDSKGSFIRVLLDYYLSEEHVKTVEVVKEVPFDNPELLERINAYENHPLIQLLFNKHKGKPFKFKDNRGQQRDITVISPYNVFEIIMCKTYPD